MTSYTMVSLRQASIFPVLLTYYSMTEQTRRSLFRPCIDLHQGVVKQIVGASLQDDDRAKDRALASSSSLTSNPKGNAPSSSSSTLKTNFTSTLSPAYYAKLYRDNNLTGAHVIKLGPGNDEAAGEAIDAWKDGLHLGGGITADNAVKWIERGAQKVCKVSLFPRVRGS